MKNLILLMGLALIAGCSGSPEPRNPMNRECDVASDSEYASVATCNIFSIGRIIHIVELIELGDHDPNIWCTNCNLDLDNDGYMDAIAAVPSER